VLPAQIPASQIRAVNGMAMASMVLGMLGLYWLGSILALIFGYLALSQIKARNERGRGVAIAGIVGPGQCWRRHHCRDADRGIKFKLTTIRPRVSRWVAT